MPEFHSSMDLPSQVAEGFLVSSASTVVISIMLATMLIFRFEGHETATRLEYATVRSPLVLLDWGIIAFLVSLITWYTGKQRGWGSIVLAGTVALLLVYAGFISIDMYRKLHREAGLGVEEIKKLHEAKKAAAGPPT